MKHVSTRFYEKNGQYGIEKITWGLGGTSGIALNDPRLVSIGNPVTHPLTGDDNYDMWLPLSISSPMFDPQALTPTYEEINEVVVDSETFIASNITRPGRVIEPASDMNPWNLPLKEGYVEIDMATYNAGKGV